MEVSQTSEPKPSGDTQQPAEATEAAEAAEEDETSPERTGPPSEASSQEWDKLTDPGATT